MFNHPTTNGLFFAMLCYKNGSLAREEVRNRINNRIDEDWHEFNSYAMKAEVLGGSKKKLGFYFPLPEIIPDAPTGTWRFSIDESGVPSKTTLSESWTAVNDARAIVESQALSMRLRAQSLLDGKPRHVYFVGGASRNPAIVSIMSQVLSSQQGVYCLTEGVTAGACARGSAIKAAWSKDANGLGFEEFVRTRWNAHGRLKEVETVQESDKAWDEYGQVLNTYSQCEKIILSEKS